MNARAFRPVVIGMPVGLRQLRARLRWMGARVRSSRLGWIVASLVVVACRKQSPQPEPNATKDSPISAATPVSHDGADERVVEPEPPRRSWRREAAKLPGKVVVNDFRGEPSVWLVGVDGEREAVDTGVKIAFAYAGGRMLALYGRTVEFRPAYDPTKTLDGAYGFDEVPWSISDAGEAGLFGEYDSDTGQPRVQLWNLWTGQGAGAPMSRLDRCPLGSQGDVAPDGASAVFACVPCDCVRREPGACEVSLCELTIVGHRAREVSTRPGGHFSPRYTGDGRVVFGSARFRETTCGRDPWSCKVDLVAVGDDALDAAGDRLAEAAVPESVSRVSGKLLVSTSSEQLGVLGPDGTDPTALPVSGRILAPRDAFSPDDAWVAVSRWPQARADGELPSPQALACPVNGGECVALGEGFATGWVRAATEQPELSIEPVQGCWKVDVEMAWWSNERPHGLDREAFGDLMGGVGLSIEANAVTLWLRGRGELHFAERFPTRVAVHPERVIFDPAEPEGYDEAAALARARSGGLLPPLRIDLRMGPIVLRRVAEDALVSSDNFLADALWGHDTGPLRWLRTACPDPIPSRPAT